MPLGTDMGADVDGGRAMEDRHWERTGPVDAAVDGGCGADQELGADIGVGRERGGIGRREDGLKTQAQSYDNQCTCSRTNHGRSW